MSHEAPLNWGLVILAIATVAIWIGRWMIESGGAEATPAFRRRYTYRILRGYALLTAVILSFIVWYYAGFSVHGNPRSIPALERRRIEHAGYYLQPGATFRFGGSEVPGAFHDPSLKGKELFELTPVFKNGAPAGIQQWRVNWSPLRQPLRANHRAINVADALWMKGGDSIRVCSGSSRQPSMGCASLTYGGTGDETFTFSIDKEAGQAEAGEQLHAQLTLNRGISEADLIRGRRDWHKNFPQLPDPYWAAFSGIIWVREREGDPTSRVGVIISDELLAQDSASIFKNQEKITSLTGLATGEQSLSNKDVVTYGLGDNLRLNLADSQRSEVDSQGRPSGIIDVRFERPVSWPLPPSTIHDSKSFVLTSSDDYNPFDGYSFDLPDPGRPFYAKAELAGKDLENWRITTARKTFRENEIVRLGPISQGVLLRLANSTAALAGWWALAAIAICTLLFFIALRMDRRQQITYRFHYIWTTVWGFTLALISFRFLTAYRLSLLPPGDAHARDLLLFNRALVKAVGGYIVPALAVLGWILARKLTSPDFSQSFSLSRGTQRARESVLRWLGIGEQFGTRRRQDVLTLIAPTVFIAIACFVRYQQQSILGLRISIWANLLTVLLLLLFCLRMPAKAGWRAALAFALFLPLVAQIVIIRDRGAVLYGTTLWGISLFVWLWHKPQRRSQRYATATFAGFQLVILLSIVLALWPRNDNVVSYRINTWLGRGSEILLSTDDQQHFDFDHFRRTMLQTWQMLAYAAQGCSNPWGYGRTPLSNVGMSYASSMSDSAYGIYVLGEHGAIVGLLLVGFLLGIGLALFLAFPYFSPDTSRAAIGIVLFAIGGFFVVHTLYMALANVGWLPFTGQNIPMLSFDSGGDLVQAGCLIGLAMFLLGAEPFSTARPSQPVIVNRKWPLRRNWGLTLLFMGLLIPVAGSLLVYRVITLGSHPEGYVRDNNLPEDVVQDIRVHIPEVSSESGDNAANPDKRRPGWQLTADGRLEPTGDISPNLIALELVDEFNTRPDKYDPQKGYIYLLSTRTNGKYHPSVRFNENYFRVALPFSRVQGWTGTIMADTAQPMPTLCGLSRRSQEGSYCLSLSEQGSGKSEQCSVQGKPADNIPPALAGLKTSGQLISDSDIVCRDDHGSPIFSVRRNGTDMLMSGYPGVTIRQDGEDYQWLTPLKPQSVIDVIVPNNPSASQNLIYLGMHRDTVAFSQWRNGRWRRVFPLGPQLPMAYALGKAADQANLETKEALPGDLQLALNLQLQRTLLGDFADYITRHKEDYLAEDGSRDLIGKRLTAVVMDAFTGEIRAMPSWPYADPGEDSFEDDLAQAGPALQMAMLRNHNFDDHVVGSTVKPLVFSSLASGFWPEQDISQLVVSNIADPMDARPNSVHLHDHIAGLPIGHAWDCDSPKTPISASDFLTYSSDYYESILAIAGSVLNKNSWTSMLNRVATHSSTPVQYKGQPYYMDLANIRNSSYPHSLFTLDDLTSGRPPLISSVNQGETVLFKQMQATFGGLQPTQPGRQTAENRWTSAAGLLPGFLHTVDLATPPASDAATPIVPEPVRIQPMGSLHPDYLLCLLGGGPACRYNNVWMAQSAARLASRKQITATLEKRVLPQQFAPLPAPLDRHDWVEAHIWEPLYQVGIKGTAKDMQKVQAINKCNGLAGSDCYLMLYKTGTLDERTEGRESEALMFIVGLWKNGEFVPGNTVAGFIYMEDAKKKRVGQSCADCTFRKFEFATPIIRDIVAHLQTSQAAQNPEEKKAKAAVAPVKKPVHAAKSPTRKNARRQQNHRRHR